MARQTWADLMSDEDEDEFLPLTSSLAHPPLTTEDTYTSPAFGCESSKVGLAKQLKELAAHADGDTNFGVLATPQKAKRSFLARTEDKAPVPNKLARRDKLAAAEDLPADPPCPSPLRCAKEAQLEAPDRFELKPDGRKAVLSKGPGAAGLQRKGEWAAEPRQSERSGGWKREPDEGWWDPADWSKENGVWRRKSELPEPAPAATKVVLRPRPEGDAKSADKSDAEEALTEEDWARRAAQRQKQVAMGISTEGYQEYKRQCPVPRPGDAVMPDPASRTPRKEFAFQLKVWRIFLHQFDKDAEQGQS